MIRFDFILYPNILYYFQDDIVLYKILSNDKNKKHIIPDQIGKYIENHFNKKKSKINNFLNYIIRLNSK
jgi:hypothetical protein